MCEAPSPPPAEIARGGDHLGGHQLHRRSPIQIATSSRGNKGTRRSAATKATMYRLPNSTTSKVIAKCSVESHSARRREWRHRREIFGCAHRNVEHHPTSSDTIIPLAP